jgi:flagellar motor switch protein FliN/FliY
MSRSTIVRQLLLAALQGAADVARRRVERNLDIAEGVTPPEARALLQFELSFGEGALLQWYVGQEDATGFSDMLVGGSGQRDAVLTDMHMDALSGVFEEMIGAAVDAMNAGLSIPLNATGVDMRMEGELPQLPVGDEQVIVGLTIDGFGDLVIIERANDKLRGMLEARLSDALVERAGGGEPAAAAPASEQAAMPAAEQPADAVQQPAATAEAPTNDSAAPDNVVPLPNLADRSPKAGQGDLRMLLNVPLNVTVELGRTERSVRDILGLGVGSILELEKLAGDPMDILVNGQVLARGEVVVLDEEFGIRITEICSPEERLRQSLA